MNRRSGLTISTLLLIAMFVPFALFASSDTPQNNSKKAKITTKTGKSKEKVYQSLVPGRSMPGAPSQDSFGGSPTMATPITPKVLRNAKEYRLKRGKKFEGDLRALPQTRPDKKERLEREEPEAAPMTYPGAASSTQSATPSSVTPPTPSAPAPAASANFDGLDFATWGAGHPPDTNGDVGPDYFIQTINTSIGVFRKTDGVRVAAFTFNTFMSQGSFGNLCDTDNFGDPVVLYDTFENRWVITDFAFKLDAGGNVNPQHAFQCFAVSRTGDPIAGGWNFYSIEVAGGLGDYPKFGVWPDGIYMSANVFGYASGAALQGPRAFALNKAQMYAGSPTVQVVTFDAPSGDFTVIPSNARLQTGTPPPGTPNYFLSTWEFTNGLTIYKFHVDWNKISLSTFSGPDVPIAATSWPNASVANAPSLGGNALDVLQIRAMMQSQYTNIGGAESLWATHTVRRATTTGFAAPRWYQVNVTGGTVAPNLPQAATWDPDNANIFHRFIPSVAVDRVGDMAIGYSTSSATTKPAINYAGRLASDPVNTFSQGEQLLIQGTGTQLGTCGSTCTRWGDYSAMTLDPDGCSFWYTSMYYAVDGLNHQTRIGSFSFPGCTTIGTGTVSGTVTDLGSGNPIGGATVALGSRTVTTDASGAYSFTSLPAGTYPGISASSPGFATVSVASLAVAEGATTTQNFALAGAAASGCLTDTAQADFQAGVATSCDLTSSPGDVTLLNAPTVNQKNETLGTSGVGITITTWAGQTFTPSVTGQLLKADINLFCSGCTGTTPNLTLSVRATSGGLPTGADLVSGTIAGFSNGASGFLTATFASPITLTAGTQYALVIRPTANPSLGTYALTRSGTSTTGANVYPGGARVSGATSGTVWSTPLTGGVSTDAGFHIYIQSGFPTSGTFVSSTKDANPNGISTAGWNTLSWNAVVPANTSVFFQVATSNSINGPFNFVGPDGTAATFFTTSGASLSQFAGSRYLKYKAFLGSTDSTVTPTLNDVTVCFNDPVTTTLQVDPATGTENGTADLSARLTGGGLGLLGKTVSFSLNGTTAGIAVTDASGIAKLTGASLAGIAAGAYPAGVGASFINDGTNGASSGTAALTVNPGPAVTSEAATLIFSKAATLNGTINPNGLSATVFFQYVAGAPTFGSATSTLSQIFTGSTVQPFSADIADLTPSTTYFYRAMVSIGGGTATPGSTLSFTTFAPPTAVSVTPNSGSGFSQTFQLLYSDQGGFAAIDLAQVIFSSVRTYGTSCAVLYTASTGSIQMKDDSGLNWSAAAKLGVPGVLQNTQCSIDAGASSAVGAGNNLALNLAVTFKTTYGGTKNIYMLTYDPSGVNSGWQTLGTWTVPLGVPSVSSVAPNAGTGASQLFQLTYSDPAGSAAIDTAQTIFSAVQTYGHSCAFLYTASTGSIQMKDDSGLNWSTTAKLGVPGVLQNTQCSIDAGASSAVGAGNNLTLSYAVTFKPAYVGTKNVYMYAVDKSGLNSGWSSRGTWNVPGAPPTIVSVLPNAGTGASQLFQLTYSDPTGFAAITQTQTIFSSVRTYGHSCAFLYTASTGSVQMKDDSGLNWSAAAKLGVPGVLQNTQCSIDAGASSAVGTGNNLTVSYAVSFKPAYTGAKSIYSLANDKFGLDSAWQTLGTWTVPASAPSILSVLPNTGTGASQLFQLTYSDPTGFAAITQTQTIFSSVRTYGHSCAFLYTASTGSIQMKDDSGLNWSAAAKLGVAGVLQNSQCSIDVGASSAVGTGTNLALNLAITFNPTYVGTKNIYSLANNKFGLNSAWQTLGTWVP